MQKLRRCLYNTVKRARITRYVHDIQEYVHIFTIQLDTRSRQRSLKNVQWEKSKSNKPRDKLICDETFLICS